MVTSVKEHNKGICFVIFFSLAPYKLSHRLANKQAAYKKAFKPQKGVEAWLMRNIKIYQPPIIAKRIKAILKLTTLKK